jgi:hypothetical protein
VSGLKCAFLKKSLALDLLKLVMLRWHSSPDELSIGVTWEPSGSVVASNCQR